MADRTNLTPKNDISPESPGSSVFDLPTQPGRLTSAPTPALRSSDDVAGPGASQVGPGLDAVPGKGPSCIVVSGGTGCNSICAAFGDACYVLPVSDDGGSSSEIIRVLGGPSIGTIFCVPELRDVEPC